MNNEIVVTVIMLAYNHGKYVSQAIDSVLMQKTNFKYEILIHDDASTDDTAKIIKEYEKKYPNIIKGIYQTENQYSKGVHFGSEFIWPIVRGKYIATCECDDYWTSPYKLQKQVDFLENNPQYSCVTHKFICVDEDNNKINKQFEMYVNYDDDYVYTIKDLEDYKLPSQTATKLYRKYMCNMTKDELQAFCNAKANGDRKCIIPLLRMGNIYCMKEFMSAYRVTYNGDSWTAKHSGKNNSLHYYNSCEALVNLSKLILNHRLDLSKYMNMYVCSAFLSFVLRPNKANTSIFISIFRRCHKSIGLYINMCNTVVRYAIDRTAKKFFSR